MVHYLLVIFAVIARLMPHPWGITPIGATGLFAGTKMPLSRAWLIPFLILFIGNLITGFYDWRVLVPVYLGFMAAPVIGRLIIRNDENPAHIMGAIGVNAFVFYLISNFGNWVAFYPHTLEGFTTNYIAGLPYMGYALIGDSFYASVLFGGQAIYRRVQSSQLLGGRAA